MKRFLLAAVFVTVAGTAVAQQSKIANMRPYDKSGINMFETPKTDTVPFDDVKVRIGAGFTQQFQALKHSNNSTSTTQLYNLRSGFNLATANLNIDAQLAKGIRLNLISYLSARHHQETWVKGGFVQIDASPVNSELLDNVFKYVTVKIGHYEDNYGDAHFRRTDNGHSLYNPFIGNYILDGFTTEIGAEIDFQKDGFLAVAAIHNGEIKGEISDAPTRNPSFIGKLGYDKQLNTDLRVRLTGSVYHNNGAAANTLYTGDRGGSRYYLVMEAAGSNAKDAAWSGNLRPGFSRQVTAFMINPFVKYQGLELFGTLEFAKGKAINEVNKRDVNQLAVEGIYRFAKNENLFVGMRYNTVTADMLFGTATQEIKMNRVQASAGWFVTKNMVVKAEYVSQKYNDFPTSNLLSGGKFKGMMFEASVGF